MPILRIPESTEALQQGDVLKGLRLLATGNDWNRAGGSSEELAAALSIVISRPCVIHNKPQIVIAAIESRTENVPAEVQTFDKVKAYLRDLRDGLTRPDRFYLGQIPGEPPGRYYAKFDSLHTVALPIEADRTELVHRFRVAALAPEFIRDLHTRLFHAFSNLGFDDIGWYSDNDLKWLIDEGDHAIQSANSAMSELIAKKSAIEAAGTSKPKQLDSLQKGIANQQRLIAELEAEVRQLRVEMTRRTTR